MSTGATTPEPRSAITDPAVTAFETDVLAELIRRKQDCLRQLFEMGKKQLDLVKNESVTELLDVLSAKQRVIDRLLQIERALDPFRDQDPDRRRWRTPQARQESAEMLDRCESLLGQIMDQEKQSEHELIRRRDRAAVQLQGAHLASQARGAYTPRPRPELSQLDLLSES